MNQNDCQIKSQHMAKHGFNLHILLQVMNLKYMRMQILTEEKQE